MKNIVLCLMVICMALTFQPFQSNAASIAEPSSIVVSEPTGSKGLLLSLNGPSTKDTTNLKSLEKRNLSLDIDSTYYQNKARVGRAYFIVGTVLFIFFVFLTL